MVGSGLIWGKWGTLKIKIKKFRENSAKKFGKSNSRLKFPNLLLTK
jgi:hypothetical protein